MTQPKMPKTLSDRELLDELVDNHNKRLGERAREAFTRWQSDGLGLPGQRRFSPPQLKWLRNVGETLGVQGAPSENIFSALSPERQAEMKANAAKVVFPWERK